jgi:hypothetical protein
MLAQTDSAVKQVPVIKKTVVAKPKLDSLGKPVARVEKKKPVTAHADTAHLLRADTLLAKQDSLLQHGVAKMKPVSPYDLYVQQLIKENVFFKADKPRYYDMNTERPYRDLDWLVYLVGFIVLLLSIVRLVYMKYFSDLFRAFLNPTLSQRQLKDQLSQSPFPNFLLNIFFSISLGLFLYLVMYRQQYITTNANAWMLIPGLMILVALIYMIKFLMLRFCGWLFGNTDLADAYIFILYLINKILGILLVPFLVILAFCDPEIARIFLHVSLFFIALLIVYRYIRSYSLVKQYLSFSRLHFFLYLCAFEVAPVLILTKVLLIWLTGNP